MEILHVELPFTWSTGRHPQSDFINVFEDVTCFIPWLAYVFTLNVTREIALRKMVNVTLSQVIQDWLQPYKLK